MTTYDYALELRAAHRTERNGFAWHSVSCICQDCLNADWAYARRFPRSLKPHVLLFEVKR